VLDFNLAFFSVHLRM